MPRIPQLPPSVSVSASDVIPIYNLASDTTYDATVTQITAAGIAGAGGTGADKGTQVYNVKAYGAVGDGVTDDSTAIQSAVTAMTGGILFFPAGTYLITTPINLKSNTRMQGAGMGAATIKSPAAQFIANSRGPIEIGINGAVSNVTVEQLTFQLGGNSAVVIANANKNIVFREVAFTGTATASCAVKFYDGSSNVTFTKCRFIDTPTTSGIYINMLNGTTTRNVLIEGCHFENIFATAIQIDDGTGFVKDVRIIGNTFIDLISTNTYGQWGVAVYGGLNTVYKISDILVEGNSYRNSSAGGTQGHGFVWFYQATNVRIIGNEAYDTLAGLGVFMAPGRVANPLIGLEVGNNYVESFDTFMDFDATNFANIHDNIVRNCQGHTNMNTPYNGGRGLDLHDNTFYNCWSTSLGGEAAIQLNNFSATAAKIHDNIWIEDTAVRHTKYGIQCTGGTFDFSDVEIYNNKFYFPVNDLEAFLTRQATTVTYPRRIENNTVVQASGVFNYNQVVGSAYGQTIEKSKTYPGANLTLAGLATPTAPTTTVTGATGTTSYNYEVVAVNADGTDGIPSAASTTITTGNATLTTSNYNNVSWPVVDGAKAYKILRSVSAGAYQVLTLATSSLADATTTGISIKDQGQYTAAAYTPLTANPGGKVGIGNTTPAAYLDIATPSATSGLKLVWRGDATNTAYGMNLLGSGAAAFTGDGALLNVALNNATDSGMALQVAHSGTAPNQVMRVIKYGAGAGHALVLRNLGTGNGLNISNESTGAALQIAQLSTGYGALIAGSVGIGNTAPTSLLDVSGTVTAVGFKMPTGAGALLNGYVRLGSGTVAKAAALGNPGELSLDNGGTDSPGIHFYQAANNNMGIDLSGDAMRFVKDLDEATGVVYVTLAHSDGTFAVLNKLTAASADVSGLATVGSFKMAAGAGTGKILTSDLNGVASWGTAGGGGITRNVATITSAVTIGAVANTDYVVFVGAAGAPTLPTAVGNTNRYTIKNVDTTNKTVATTSSQTIDGSTTITLTPNTAVDVVSDNSNWKVI